VKARRRGRVVALLGLLLASCAAPEGGSAETDFVWSRVLDVPRAALLSVHGTASDDVWVVGADDGSGPQVQHWDGARWKAFASGSQGNLWWVHTAPDGTTYLAGSDGTVLRRVGGRFEPLPTPASNGLTVYGLWAASGDSLYAVGAAEGGTAGFLWHFDGNDFRELELPATEDAGEPPGLFKVWGRDADEVWVVGSQGMVLCGNADAGFRRVPSGTTATLFTVHAAAGRVVMVGGDAGGALLEVEGDELVDHTPDLAPLLQGVTVADDGTAWAVGLGGSLYRSGAAGEPFEPVDPGLDVGAVRVLHGVWSDERGQVWSAGGNVFSGRLDGGLVLRYGSP